MKKKLKRKLRKKFPDGYNFINVGLWHSIYLKEGATSVARSRRYDRFLGQITYLADEPVLSINYHSKIDICIPLVALQEIYDAGIVMYKSQLKKEKDKELMERTKKERIKELCERCPRNV